MKNIHIPVKILCRTCAEYGGCKCRKFWEHRLTSDFTKHIK